MMDGLRGEPIYRFDIDSEMYMMDGNRIATHIRNGGDRGALRVVTNGTKLSSMIIDNPHVRRIIGNTGLAPLVDLSYEEIDRAMLSAFVERWEHRTSSFHLPYGEMTITLDDVTSLLHIPVTGTFFTLPTMSDTVAEACLMGLLGVSHQVACLELKKTQGPLVRLSWLQARYLECLQIEEWEYAARAYLLLLVGSTLFMDKSSKYVSVQYLELFRDLSSVHKYAWGTAALAFLYDQLDEASYINVKAIGGYATLLQAWVYEHFPTIVDQEISKHYTEAMPRALQWVPHHSSSEVLTTRRFLDGLSLDDICWEPYEDHRGNWAFENVSLYSGYIRCGDIVATYLPERVLRQFGRVQGIPLPPQHVTYKPKTIEDVDQMWDEYEEHMIKDVIQVGDFSDEYSRWFSRVSNPFLIPSNIPTIELSGMEKIETPDSSIPLAIPLNVVSPNELRDKTHTESNGKVYVEVPDSKSGRPKLRIVGNFERILEANHLKHENLFSREAVNIVNRESDQHTMRRCQNVDKSIAEQPSSPGYALRSRVSTCHLEVEDVNNGSPITGAVGMKRPTQQAREKRPIKEGQLSKKSKASTDPITTGSNLNLSQSSNLPDQSVREPTILGRERHHFMPSGSSILETPSLSRKWLLGSPCPKDTEMIEKYSLKEVCDEIAKSQARGTSFLRQAMLEIDRLVAEEAQHAKEKRAWLEEREMLTNKIKEISQQLVASKLQLLEIRKAKDMAEQQVEKMKKSLEADLSK